jgi:hypothetical protein
MPVDKFGRTDEKVVQHTPIVTSSIGLTMAQINNTFLRRDGGNVMTADLNLKKHRLINLSEPTAADNAVTRQDVGDTFLKLESLENVVDVDGLDLDFFAEPLHLVPLEGNTYLVDPFVHDNHVTDSQLVQAAEDVDPPASIIQQLELPFDGMFYDCDEEL